MENKKVSVIIPSLNRYKFLMNAIKSIENQSYENIEIIVVNDGSTDSRYLNLEAEKNVKVLHINRDETPNWGGSRPAVRNYGIEVATGEYIAFLDDDDIWLENKIETQLSYMDKNNIHFSCTEGFFGYGVYDVEKNYAQYNSQHHIKKIKKKFRKTPYLKKEKFPLIWDYEFLKFHNCVVLSSVLVKTDIMKELGGFRGLYRSEYFVHTADHDCWLGLLQLTNLIYIDTPLFYYDSGHGDGKNYIN